MQNEIDTSALLEQLNELRQKKAKAILEGYKEKRAEIMVEYEDLNEEISPSLVPSETLP